MILECLEHCLIEPKNIECFIKSVIPNACQLHYLKLSHRSRHSWKSWLSLSILGTIHLEKSGKVMHKGRRNAGTFPSEKWTFLPPTKTVKLKMARTDFIQTWAVHRIVKRAAARIVYKGKLHKSFQHRSFKLCETPNCGKWIQYNLLQQIVKVVHI